MYLRVVGIVVSVLAVALSLSMAIVISSAFQLYEQNLSFVTQGALRLATSLAAQNDVRNLVAAGMGWESASNDTIATYRAQILANASMYQVGAGHGVLLLKCVVRAPPVRSHHSCTRANRCYLQRIHSGLYSTISADASADPSSAVALDEYTK